MDLVMILFYGSLQIGERLKFFKKKKHIYNIYDLHGLAKIVFWWIN